MEDANADDRFYPIRSKESPGNVCFVRGIPDPEQPDKPGKDGRGTEEILATPAKDFWAAALAADYVWTSRGFDRYWALDPRRAERVRAGGGIPASG